MEMSLADVRTGMEWGRSLNDADVKGGKCGRAADASVLI